MSEKIIEFGEWLPDQPDLGNSLIHARNVIPYAKSYKSFPSPTVYSSALSSYAKGFIAVTDKDGNAYNYAGDISDLYRLTDTTWTNATRATSGSYSVAEEDFWEFAQWGERVLATNFANDIQAITAGASNFATLAGTPPRARHIAVIRDFVVLGNVTDYSTGVAVANRVHWSGFNNVETYEPTASTQADFQDLQGEGGWVQKVIGGEYGIVFQERAIWRMTYVGSPLVFQFDEVERGRGTPVPNSVVNYGSTIFYLGHDDFYMFNGSSSTPIGNNKIYKEFIRTFNSAYAHRMTATIDPMNTLVLWAYPSSGSSVAGIILVYNWALNRWSIITGSSEAGQGSYELISSSLSTGYTLDSLDSVSTDIDALPFSLDSRAWTGGTLNLISFNFNHEMNIFDGSALPASVTTGERQLSPHSRSLIVNTRPLVAGNVDGVIYTVQVAPSDLLTDRAANTLPIASTTAGECPVFSEGRYHKFTVNITGEFTDLQGIIVDFEKQGRY